MKFPKIIHLIYIPWDKKQKLKKDYMDFDITFYNNFKKKMSGWKIEMWTWDKIELFMNSEYKDEWNLIKKYASRPTMLVDYLRWKIVYYYGGIYWQYGSKLKKSIKRLIPKSEKHITLLTETELNIFTRYLNSLYRIRNGEPEERIRVANQVFAAYPKNRFVKKVLKQLLRNIQKYKVKEDYDILYIGANALISKVYDSSDKTFITLLSLEESHSLVSFFGKGSWRTDSKKFLLF